MRGIMLAAATALLLALAACAPIGAGVETDGIRETTSIVYKNTKYLVTREAGRRGWFRIARADGRPLDLDRAVALIQSRHFCTSLRRIALDPTRSVAEYQGAFCHKSRFYR